MDNWTFDKKDNFGPDTYTLITRGNKKEILSSDYFFLSG